MDNIEEYGWAIHLGVLPYAKGDDEITLSFNLVRPGATNEESRHWIADEQGPQCDSAEIIKDNLLFPWNWEKVEWSLFENNVLTKSQIEIKEPCGSVIQEKDNIKEALESEIKVKTSKCSYPYSVQAEYTDGKNYNQSIPHAIAPLTHLPEPISNQELKMSGFLTIDRASIVGKTNVAIFPIFESKNKSNVFTIKHVTNYVNYSRAEYLIDNTGSKVAFYCNLIFDIPEVLISPEPLPFFSEPQINENNPEQVRTQAISNLNPLAIIRKDLILRLEEAEKDKNKPLELAAIDYRLALIKALGLGWEARRNVKENPSSSISDKTVYPHVFEFLLDKAKAENIELIALLISSDDRAQLITKLEALDTENVFVELIKQAANLSKALEKKLKILNKVNDLSEEEKTDKSIAQAWIDVANMADHPEEGKKVYALFWTVALTKLIDTGKYKLPSIDYLSSKLSNELIKRTRAALIFEGYKISGDYGVEVQKLIQNGVFPAVDSTERSSIIESLIFLVNSFFANGVQVIKDEVITNIFSYLDDLKAYQPKSVNHDAGITLNFSNSNLEDADSNSKAADQDIRGYAIALQSGLKKPDGSFEWDDDRANWITDTQILLTNTDKTYTFLASPMHEAVGATLVNGQRVISREYTGRPLNAHLVKIVSENNETTYPYVEAKKEDFDQTDALDYVWAIEDKLPLLGYGMFYKGLATPIGNAGEVVHDEHRDNCLTKLKSADVILARQTVYSTQYLSNVPPGSPVLQNAQDLITYQELSEETRAHAFQACKKSTIGNYENIIQPVSLLCDNDKFFTKKLKKLKNETVELIFTTPTPSSEFLTRWLNTDLLRKEKNLSDSNSLFKDTDIPKIRKLIDSQAHFISNLEKEKPKDVDLLEAWNKRKAFHPAVKFIGLCVTYNGEETPKPYNQKAFALIQKTENGFLMTEPLSFTVELSDDLNTVELSNDLKVDKLKHKIKLKQGDFCKVSVFCLIDEKFFLDGEKNRFDNTLVSDNKMKLDVESDQIDFRRFGSLDLWFEATPKWENKPIDFNPKLESELAVANLKVNADLAADWLRGCYIERHEWHWTGYPITFPNTNNVNEWVNTLVGVESYRDSHYPTFITHLDQNGWKIGNQGQSSMVVHKHPLTNGSRPARYMAFTIRPVVRFSKWLKKPDNINMQSSPLDLEKKIFAVGGLIKGISPGNVSERLPLPPLKWSIPLISTYVESKDPKNKPLPERSANGNMLIFDEAIRRTDSLTKFGGVGDTLEIDLMATRLSGFKEIGVNPIIYKAPEIEHGKLIDEIDLEYDEPFGLTYDITSNAKVAQTGVIVRPTGAEGKWLLAKIRARRLILPETIHDSKIILDKDNRYYLSLRQVGDERIPVDFCIDCEELTVKSITLDQVKIPIPQDIIDSSPSRLLCSFHKGYWNIGEAKWRIQILAQAKDGQSLAWKNGEKLSCLDSTNKDLPSFIDKAPLSIEADSTTTVSSVRMSDYTDPIWLTFIGSFGMGNELNDKSIAKLKIDYLKSESDKLTLIGSGEAFKTLQTHLKAFSDQIEIISKEPCFHMLMVFKPISDICISENLGMKNSGQFIGFYKYSNGGFKNFKLEPEVKTLNDCFAYLCTFQLVTSLSLNESTLLNLDSSPNFINAMFPSDISDPNDWDKSGNHEALIRLLPEYLGPIKIM